MNQLVLRSRRPSSLPSRPSLARRRESVSLKFFRRQHPHPGPAAAVHRVTEVVARLMEGDAGGGPAPGPVSVSDRDGQDPRAFHLGELNAVPPDRSNRIQDIRPDHYPITDKDNDSFFTVKGRPNDRRQTMKSCQSSSLRNQGDKSETPRQGDCYRGCNPKVAPTGNLGKAVAAR